MLVERTSAARPGSSTRKYELPRMCAFSRRFCWLIIAVIVSPLKASCSCSTVAPPVKCSCIDCCSNTACAALIKTGRARPAAFPDADVSPGAIVNWTLLFNSRRLAFCSTIAPVDVPETFSRSNATGESVCAMPLSWSKESASVLTFSFSFVSILTLPRNERRVGSRSLPGW